MHCPRIANVTEQMAVKALSSASEKENHLVKLRGYIKSFLIGSHQCEVYRFWCEVQNSGQSELVANICFAITFGDDLGKSLKVFDL